MKDNNTLSPSYYNRNGISCSKIIEVITSPLKGVEAYYLGCAIKYLYRYMYKNGIEDLRKAITYINFIIHTRELGDIDDYYTESGNDSDYESKYTN